ncbi:carbohydrate porin [Limnohabitans sp.]|uniref:carbohydrate porin n=1 Tax=Limnohabitans sp. TaxID=1907725 RepID=UPI00286EF749|nr:carbohydrate porin [Limnohabitans sp.]
MKMKLTCAAAALCCLSSAAFAADVGGVEVTGYSRGGGVYNYNKDQQVKGGLTLGGDLQKYRLGNEGDTGVEVNIAKTFDVEGVKYKLDYMPTKWNSGNVGTEQAFVEMTGLNFAPEAKIWVGQRRLRIQDVHIVDHFLMDYGVNQGSGFTDLSVGGMKLGVALQTGDTFDAKMAAGTSANKLNIDLSEINTNPGGKVRVLLTSVSTSGLKSSGGSGFTISHNQSDFGVKGLTNSLFLQTSSGYANINGRFGDIAKTATSDPYGKKVNRIADSINWQSGPFGGQAIVGHQTTKSDDPAKNYTITDTSLGGRISYAVSKNFKWLVEAGTTARKFSDSQKSQSLNKVTIAPTLALGEEFWSRPELRFYVTKANWNQAAADANADVTSGFGANGRTSQTLAGVQYEVWW